MTMTIVTNIGIALTVIFVISLGVLVAQITWVLWRRNKSLHNCDGGSSGQGDVESGVYCMEPAKTTEDSCCFCCCRWKDGRSSSTKVDPDGSRGHTGAPTGDGLEEDFDEVIKYWHKMCRESRILCTIKEEEHEEKQGQSDKNGELVTLESEEEKGHIRVCLREWLEMRQESLDHEMAIIIMNVLRTKLMRLSTPHDSPDQHFTPSPSPPQAERDDMDENCT